MYAYTLSRPSPDNLSLLQYSSLMSILSVYLFYLAFDPGHLKHTSNREKESSHLVFCLSHPFWPCPAQSLLAEVQSLKKGKVKTADVQRAREELRALVTAVKASLDHNNRWGGRLGLVCAGVTLLLLASLFHYWSQSAKCSLEGK